MVHIFHIIQAFAILLRNNKILTIKNTGLAEYEVRIELLIWKSVQISSVLGLDVRNLDGKGNTIISDYFSVKLYKMVTADL